MSEAGVNKTFDWYRLIVELGNFEVEHARVRFYEQAKLHLAIAAGVLSLGAYAISNDLPTVLFLSAGASTFGAVNASAWLGQVDAASAWESRWRRVAAELERTPEFRAAVGANNVAAWSSEELRSLLGTQAKQSGATPTMFSTFTRSIRTLYVILACGGAIYGLYLQVG